MQASSRRRAVSKSGARMLPRWLVLAGAAALGSCVPRVAAPPPVGVQPPPVVPPAPVTPANAVAAGVKQGPAVSSLLTAPKAAAALAAFRISCPSVMKREDASGLTRAGDWWQACDAAGSWPDANAAAFFTTHFEAAEVGGGNTFITGYFEPQIAGSRVRAPGYDVPVYRKPPEVVEISAEAAAAAGTPRRGRLVNGVITPYFERSEIVGGALAGRGLEIAWAADEIDFFFLQIQGSGRLKLPDGNVMRIGYAGQNGREYVGIGKLLKDRGLLGNTPTSMQGIVSWLRANPEQGRAIMNENKSYIFFQELTGPGPLGALNLPVTGRVTVATDPKFVPLGAPVVLDVDRPEVNGLWVAQDVGGAIKGANRFDTFWGAGEEAAITAGGMQARGRAYVLVPKGTVARLSAGGDGVATSQR